MSCRPFGFLTQTNYNTKESHEIVCVLRYGRHYFFFMAASIHAEAVAADSLVHANGECCMPNGSRSSQGCVRRRFPGRPRAELGRSLRSDDSCCSTEWCWLHTAVCAICVISACV